MEPDLAIEFAKEAIWTSLLVAAPVLIVGTIVAIVLGVIQSMMHLQDHTIGFVPKLLLVALVMIACLPWCADRLLEFSVGMFESPRLIRFKLIDESPSTAGTDRLAPAAFDREPVQRAP